MHSSDAPDVVSKRRLSGYAAVLTALLGVFILRVPAQALQDGGHARA